jgi:hypothetical protein
MRIITATWPDAPVIGTATPGHRGGLLVRSQVTPPGTMLRLAEKLGGEKAASLRTLIDHAF